MGVVSFCAMFSYMKYQTCLEWVLKQNEYAYITSEPDSFKPTSRFVHGVHETIGSIILLA